MLREKRENCSEREEKGGRQRFAEGGGGERGSDGELLRERIAERKRRKGERENCWEKER